uniref:GRIP domain-containing protein n=1 Tax=Panagrolaimus davidi TaxID=227884 RepID=A0A914PGM3_9BILA
MVSAECKEYQEQIKKLENLLSEKATLIDKIQANEANLIHSVNSFTNECENYKQKIQDAETQLSEKVSNEQKLNEKLNYISSQCKEYQEEIKKLQNQLSEKTVVIDELHKQMNQMNSVNTEELTSNFQAMQQEVQRLNAELKASHDSQAKLQNHVQKLMDNLQAKDDEVSQLAAEMENQAVDGPRAINTVKEMLQTKIKECNAYAEKTEQLKRNISQYTQQLQEKDQLILELQKIRENLLLSNEHLEKEFGRCRTMLEKLTSQSNPSDAATVKKLQDELTLLTSQYNIVKQVCFKMFIDEERGFDHSMLLINLLNYDDKSKSILKEYVTAKYQGTLEGFFKKFNFTSTAQLAQELLKFVDQDIAKSKISLAPVSEPAFQMKVDETLPEPSSDSNDLRNIIQ